MVSEQSLAAQIGNLDLHRTLLGGYRGAYSLGVTKDTDGGAALLLKVEDSFSANPNHVTVGASEVKVIVKRGFRAPVPLAAIGYKHTSGNTSR